MKPLSYFLIVDIIILIVAVKLIFKTYANFFKAIVIYFNPVNEFIESPYKEWEKEHDSNHKIHILYWIILALVGLSILIYYLFIDSSSRLH